MPTASTCGSTTCRSTTPKSLSASQATSRQRTAETLNERFGSCRRGRVRRRGPQGLHVPHVVRLRGLSGGLALRFDALGRQGPVQFRRRVPPRLFSLPRRTGGRGGGANNVAALSG